MGQSPACHWAGTLIVTALLAYPNTSKLRLAALLILQGCQIEVLQFFSGYRFGEWRDAAANALCVLLELSLGALLKKLFLKHLQSV